MTTDAYEAGAHKPEEGDIDLTVVVPVAERPRPLEEVYRNNEEALRSTGLRFEVCFVIQPWGRALADGLKSLVEAGEPVRILELGQRANESEMISVATARSTAPLILTLPAYPRVEPQGLPGLVSTVEQGADMAVAVRDGSGNSVINSLQRRAFHLLLRFGVGGDFSDIACGVRVFRRRILEHVPLYGDFFRFFPYLVAREGYRVVQLTLEADPADRQTRVFNPGVYIRRLVDLVGLSFLVRFTAKPLRFFGLVGTLSAGIGGLLLVLLAWQRINGRPLADRPMLVLSVLLLVLGIQAIALGLVGEIVVHFHAAERKGYRLGRDRTLDSPGVGDDP